MLTREEALELFKKASDVAGNYLEYVEVVSMHNINIVLSEIFNDHEAQLKAKDEEIKAKDEALELIIAMCELGLKTQDTYSTIIQKLKAQNKALQSRSCDECKNLVEIGKSFKHCDELAINISHMDWGSFCCNRYEAKPSSQ